jgi:hypothetical protein
MRLLTAPDCITVHGSMQFSLKLQTADLSINSAVILPIVTATRWLPYQTFADLGCHRWTANMLRSRKYLIYMYVLRQHY